jgi:hypothetical protein
MLVPDPNLTLLVIVGIVNLSDLGEKRTPHPVFNRNYS